MESGSPRRLARASPLSPPSTESQLQLRAGSRDAEQQPGSLPPSCARALGTRATLHARRLSVESPSTVATAAQSASGTVVALMTWNRGRPQDMELLSHSGHGHSGFPSRRIARQRTAQHRTTPRRPMSAAPPLSVPPFQIWQAILVCYSCTTSS